VVSRGQADPGYRFTLDGQMAVVQDYLEVRPEQRAAICVLVGSGQLAIGPWRVLLDEFLCSGENIVRNLEMGWSAASGIGTPMAVGYLPDMFGHCAQMPQILALAGIRHACVWRGVPALVDRHAFLWRSPDGTGLRTEYLAAGYGSAADLFAMGGGAAEDNDHDRWLQDRLAARVRDWAPWFGADPLLAMYGTDHAAPLPTLMQQVATLSVARSAASPGRDATDVQVCTLADYVLARDPDETGLPVVDGELRSHARANILPGVISVRWHLKEAMGRAERMVERYAEPWAALWSAQWPQAYLDLAWSRLVDSSCHDSVTGCGVDETALQVAARIAEGEHAGQAVRDQAVDVLASRVPRGSVVVVNPTPAARTGLVELDVPVPDYAVPGPAVPEASVPEVAPVITAVVTGLRLPDGRLIEAQEVGRNERVLLDEQVDADALAAVFGRVHDRELFGQQVTHVDLDPSGRSLAFHVASDAGPAPFDAAGEQQRAVLAAADNPGSWRVLIRDEDRRRVVAMVPVPALGWTAVTAVTGLTAASGVGREPGPVLDGFVLDNGLLEISLRPDGALRLESRDGTVLDGVGQLVDGGDCGDSYNYGPPSADLLVAQPDEVSFRVLERGQVRSVLEISRRYAWPARSAQPDKTRAAQVSGTRSAQVSGTRSAQVSGTRSAQVS
ncbi:MAG TPA: hypothetical protein VN712_01440, partial [Dermatophilaceae bacterium]|nr:hypothetical protein [Dermatophilaceae bacterium]